MCGIGGSHYDIPKALLYLLKRDCGPIQSYLPWESVLNCIIVLPHGFIFVSGLGWGLEDSGLGVRDLGLGILGMKTSTWMLGAWHLKFRDLALDPKL